MKETSGVSTGFPRLDEVFGGRGLTGGITVVDAKRGFKEKYKDYFLKQIAVHVNNNGYPLFYLSSEDFLRSIKADLETMVHRMSPNCQELNPSNVWLGNYLDEPLSSQTLLEIFEGYVKSATTSLKPVVIYDYIKAPLVTEAFIADLCTLRKQGWNTIIGINKETMCRADYLQLAYKTTNIIHMSANGTSVLVECSKARYNANHSQFYLECRDGILI